jgi:hypothetical protein
MSFMTSQQVAPSERPRSLYFAYGSNLQLKQMAKRCPDSQYQGRARLHHFRWQINDRGFANVIPDPNAFVEGLCYLLSAEDEMRLDRSEGVPTAYQKKWAEVEFFPAAVKLGGRRVTEILRFDLMERNGQPPAAEARASRTESADVEPAYRAGAEPTLANDHPRREVTEITYFVRDGRTQAIEETGTSRRRGQSVPAGNRNHTEGRPPANITGRSHGEPARALVYLSQNHIKEGLPWDEYVERMNWGIIDAMDLGISHQYIEQAITPFILAATGFNSNGEPRGRGVRERKKRSRYTNTIKKQRRVGEPESADQREQTTMPVEPMDWDVTQEARQEYHEYQGS